MTTAHWLALGLAFGCLLVAAGYDLYNKSRVGGPHVAFDLISALY